MKLSNKLFVATCVAALGVATNAQAIDEVEANHPIGAAQSLPAASAHSINGMMGNAGDAQSDDLDYYDFEASAGDVLGVKSSNSNHMAVLGIFDANGKLLRMAYGKPEARIDNFAVPASGRYTIGVSSGRRMFVSGGGVMSFFGSSTSDVGAYTLTTSGITVAAKTKQINIEVKPGNEELSPLNPRSNGKVPVAILGSGDFSVADIDQKTLTFGSRGDEASLSKCQPNTQDFNGDGQADLLCHFENSMAGFKSGDLEGVLRGSTTKATGAISFEGHGLLKVVPSARK